MKTTGQTILITGGTSGLGLGFAEKFHQLGNAVIICARRKDRLKKIERTHPGMATIVCDVADGSERERLRDEVVEKFPATNVLINNAGVQFPVDLARPVDLECVRAEIEINLTAPIHLGSLFARHLAARKPAAIINISSGLAFTPMAFAPVYCATKAALHSLTLSLRYQLRKSGIRVFEIIPPWVATELGRHGHEEEAKPLGGIPVSEFIESAVQAIEEDVLEAPIGSAKGLCEKREALFAMINR
jgi:uncharacterized oxidoreductase